MSLSDAGAAADGALSIDQASGLLGELRGKPPAAEAEQPIEETPESTPQPEAGAEDAPEPAEDQEHPAEAQTADDGDAPEEDPPAGETDDADQDEPADEPAVDPPHYWASEDKAAFEALPHHLQETLVKHDANRERAVNQAIEHAANARKAHEAEASGVRELRGKLDRLLPEAEQVFAARWGDVDWLDIAKEHGAETAEVLKEQHDADKSAIEAIRKASKDSEAAAFKAHLAEEGPKIAETIPELVDPARGPGLRAKLTGYLQNEGYSADELKWAGARDWSMAWKAMQWDAAQAALKAKPKPDPKSSQSPSRPAAPAKAAKPSAAAPAAPPRQREADTASRRLSQTGDVDDAVALLRARRRA